MGGVPQLPFGLVTAPGDVPVRDVADATTLALGGREMPTVPVVSEPTCSLLAQSLVALEGASVLPTGELCVEGDRFAVAPDALDLLQDPSFAALHHFCARWSAGDRQSVVALRVDLVGPVTLALALCRSGVSLPQALDAARLVSARRAVALLGAVRAVEARRPVAVVMSEPRLVGSMHPTFPLSVRQVRSLLDPVVDAVDEAAGDTPVLIGVHAPGRCDWRTIVTSGISLLSMPADAAIVGWAEWVQALLDNGGFVAWGAVPVDRPVGTSEELLWRQLSAVWGDLVGAGVDPVALRERCLVSPADGLGGFGVEQVGVMWDLVGALAERVRRQAIGTRLGVGA